MFSGLNMIESKTIEDNTEESNSWYGTFPPDLRSLNDRAASTLCLNLAKRTPQWARGAPIPSPNATHIRKLLLRFS